jgi:peptide/nickel transport system permease protein
VSRYALTQGALAILMLVGISLVTFLLTFLSGDPVALMLPAEATVEERAAFRQQLGLDQPLHVQYARFLRGALRGDFGQSLRHNEPALPLVLSKLPATLELATAALILGTLGGIPLGVAAAIWRGSASERFAMGAALAGQSIPNFWLGIMLIYLFAATLMWLPSVGRGGIQNLILPSFTLAVNHMAVVCRLTRSTMLDVLAEDYVRTARAKGASEMAVVMRHALSNGLIPIVTVVGLRMGFLIGGAVVVETVFVWPGVGLLAVQAIYNRDFPVVQAAVFIMASAFVLINMLMDILYAWLDPRIRIGGGR